MSSNLHQGVTLTWYDCGMNRVPFAIDEWYHCFSRGVDKRRTFQNLSDYQRFLQLLYLANSDTAVHRSDLKLKHKDIFTISRGRKLVSIVAFCLMPNHFHLVLREETEGGISRFMQKLGTAYTMYFNIRNERVGNLFVKPFRSKHIADDEYLNHVVQYIHLNPLEIYEPDWKRGLAFIAPSLEAELRTYSYSSLPSYLNQENCERAILDEFAMSLVDTSVSLSRILKDAREYYAELNAYAHASNVKVSP